MASRDAFTAALSPASNAMFERNVAWLKSREDDRSRLVRTLQQKQVEGLQSSPRITRASEGLAAKRASVDVVTRLLADGAAFKASKAALAAEIHASEFIGVPAITRFAAELKREGAVGDRLFAEAGALRKKKAALVSGLLRLEAEAGRKSAVRKPLTSVEGTYAAIPAHTLEQLHAGGAEAARKREEARLKLAKEARDAAYPALNPRSLKLAAAMPRERNDAIYKRVLEGMGPRTVKAAPLPPDVTFAPKIAPRSVALAAKRNAAEPMTVEARLSRQAVATSDKVKELSRVQAELEMAECTFHPNTDGSALLAATRVRAGLGESRMGGPASPRGAIPPPVRPAEVEKVFKRNAAWLADRDARLVSARRDAEDRETIGCTFEPNAGRRRRASIAGGTSGTEMLVALASAGHAPASATAQRSQARRSSLPGRVGSLSALRASSPGSASGTAKVGTLPGVDAFASRLAKARALAEEVRNPSWVPDGSKWTGRMTTPSAPVLRTATSPSAAAVSSRTAAAAAARVAYLSGAVEVHTRGGASLGAALSAHAPPAPPAPRPVVAVAPAPAPVAAAPPAVPPRRSPEDIIRDTIARSLGALSGSGSGGGGGEAVSAEDIRARLATITSSGSSNVATTATGTGRQLRVTLLGGSGSGAGSGGGGGSGSAFSRVGGGDFGAEPPQLRFGSGGMGLAVPAVRAAAPDPLLDRVSAMAALAAGGR